MDGPHSDHLQITKDAEPASDESRGVSSKQPGPLEDTYGRPDIHIHQFRNVAAGLRFMVPQGDEYHQNVEVSHPQPRREERFISIQTTRTKCSPRRSKSKATKGDARSV